MKVSIAGRNGGGSFAAPEIAPRYDVVVLGAGLAGLALARQLLLDSDRSVLVLERREVVPPERQKVGESLVQLAGWYFSKVLDLEEHLLTEHYLKNNLRFHWKTAGRRNAAIEDYSQAGIRELSNICSYQLDRNVLEAELLRLVAADPRATVTTGVSGIDVALGANDADHDVAFRRGDAEHHVAARWVVDASGRSKLLAKELELGRPSPIRHASFFWWVDGLVDVERLSDLDRRARWHRPGRETIGHVPTFLATNHFMGDGFWFWVIPLHGKTSLGIVFDRERIDPGEVFTVEKATAWVCREFPLFARDLPERRVLAFGGFKDYAYDCAQTISAGRWAMVGEAGRFSDPLYSPGSDLIAIYNTLVVDAVTADEATLAAKCELFEQLEKAVFQAYVPSYLGSYAALGDREVFTLKYTWELTIYFAGYVFPFINDLLTERRFALAFLRLFAQLGPLNHAVQELLADFHRWKREHAVAPAAPEAFDFTSIAPLARAKETFYRVRLEPGEAKRELARQVENAGTLARWIAAHVAAETLGEPRARHDRGFVGALEVARLPRDVAKLRTLWETHRDGGDHDWGFAADVLVPFSDRAMAAEDAARELVTT